MKITLIGAAGVRTPLLVHGLAGLGAAAHLDELALWDTDPDRLTAMKRVAEAMAKRRGLGARLKAYSDPEAALQGANYVISSIRVGGIAARVKDETIALAHGLVGQETVGAGGFACAMRNLATMLDYARMIDRVAPTGDAHQFHESRGNYFARSSESFGSERNRRLRHAARNFRIDRPRARSQSIRSALRLSRPESLGLGPLNPRQAQHRAAPQVLASPEIIREMLPPRAFPARIHSEIGPAAHGIPVLLLFPASCH